MGIKHNHDAMLKKVPSTMSYKTTITKIGKEMVSILAETFHVLPLIDVIRSLNYIICSSKWINLSLGPLKKNPSPLSIK
jgi:hypothetical protein